MSLSVDGTPATGIATGTNTVVSGTLTTSLTNDIVVAIVGGENASSTPPAVSGMSNTGSLGAWTKRKAFSYAATTGAGSPDLEIWWAKATSTFTGTVTATFTGTFDDASIVVFAVNGADTTTPFDANVSLPATAKQDSNTAIQPSIASISTTNANTMLIGAITSGNGSVQTTQTAGTGFTFIAEADETGGGNTSQTAAERKIVAAAQSSVTVTFGVNWANWAMIADAIQAAASGDTFGNDMMLLMM